MLVDRVLAAYDLPQPEDQGGNPLRGSRLGRCARQSAYMRWPDQFPPEPLPARTRLVFAFGDMIHDLVRKNFRRVCPGEWGMEEERFHFKVPLTTKEAGAAWNLFLEGSLRGNVQAAGVVTEYPSRDRFADPWVQPPHRRGLWLDTAEPALYIPLHVDGIADTGSELAACEIKSMTTAGFRWALAGKVEYSYRVQMAAAVDATGLEAALYIACRKDTCHLLEVLYARKVEKVAVTFTKQSQLIRSATARLPQSPQEESAADTSGKHSATAGTGQVGGVGGHQRADDATPMDDWEAARVDHPFEPHLLEEARARVKRILLATPTNLPPREYGPDFTCATCEGTGTQQNAKGTGLPLKKGPKPCADCEKADVPVGEQEIGGVGAPTGQLKEAELPWNCRYCPSIVHCWSDVKPRLEFDREGKPHYWVARADFKASGITVEGPRG